MNVCYFQPYPHVVVKAKFLDGDGEPGSWEICKVWESDPDDPIQNYMEVTHDLSAGAFDSITAAINTPGCAISAIKL